MELKRGDTKMTEKPRGEIVNPHVVDAPLEPAPDFKSMQKAINMCICLDSDGEPLNQCGQCPR